MRSFRRTPKASFRAFDYFDSYDEKDEIQSNRIKIKNLHTSFEQNSKNNRSRIVTDSISSYGFKSFSTEIQSNQISFLQCRFNRSHCQCSPRPSLVKRLSLLLDRLVCICHVNLVEIEENVLLEVY